MQTNDMPLPVVVFVTGLVIYAPLVKQNPRRYDRGWVKTPRSISRDLDQYPETSIKEPCKTWPKNIAKF